MKRVAAPLEPNPNRRAPTRVEAGAPKGAVDRDVDVRSLKALKPALEACRRCDLWRDATQGVPGEGPARAKMMLVGEQPGDQEDLQGKPFVGPAGRLLDEALEAAGVPREDCYVTNAVKHFKFERRGKRRIHSKPGAGEIDACRWWLDTERRLVRPKVIVVMGASAGRAVFGRPVTIKTDRGTPLALSDGGTAVLTVHPSFLLRIPDASEKAKARKLFVADLKAAWRLTA